MMLAALRVGFPRERTKPLVTPVRNTGGTEAAKPRRCRARDPHCHVDGEEDDEDDSASDLRAPGCKRLAHAHRRSPPGGPASEPPGSHATKTIKAKTALLYKR